MMILRGIPFLPRRYVPKPVAAVPEHRSCKRFAIRSESNRASAATAAAPPVPYLFTASHIPQSERAIDVSRSQALAVRRKGERRKPDLIVVAEGPNFTPR